MITAFLALALPVLALCGVAYAAGFARGHERGEARERERYKVGMYRLEKVRERPVRVVDTELSSEPPA